MESIPIRELNQHTSAVVARVAAGESLEVTVSGRPAALLVPPAGQDGGGLRELARAGRVVLATDPTPFPLPTGEPDDRVDSTEIVSELREDRL